RDVDEPAIDERENRTIQVAHRDRGVPPEPEYAEPIDPGVVARLRAARIGDIFQLRPGQLKECPSFGALLSRRRGLRVRFALPAIEACEMAARERYPIHAVTIDVAAARSEAGRGRLVYFGER